MINKKGELFTINLASLPSFLHSIFSLFLECDPLECRIAQNTLKSLTSQPNPIPTQPGSPLLTINPTNYIKPIKYYIKHLRRETEIY